MKPGRTAEPNTSDIEARVLGKAIKRVRALKKGPEGVRDSTNMRLWRNTYNAAIDDAVRAIAQREVP